MNTETIGSCNLCGGAVTVPAMWFGIVPPIPTCSACGATKRENGPVIEMERGLKWEDRSGNFTVRISDSSTWRTE